MEMRQHVVIVPTTAPANRHSIIQIAVVGIALFLQLVGYVTPGWSVAEYGRYIKVHGGLWYIVGCEENNDQPCEVYSVFDKEQLGIEMAQDLQGEQIETSFAIVCAIVTVALVIKVHRMGENQTSRMTLNAITSIFAIISGVLALVSSGGIADEHVKFAQLLKDNDGNDGFIIIFPYSLVLFGVGGIMMCCTGIYLFVKLVSQCTKQQQQMNNAHNQNGVNGAPAYVLQNMAHTPPTVVGTSNTARYSMAVNQPQFVQNMGSNAGPYVASEKPKQMLGPHASQGVENAGYVGSMGRVGSAAQTQSNWPIQYQNNNIIPVSTEATRHAGHTTHFMSL